MKVVAIVGMAGAGKSEVARTFASNDFIRVRFGDVTDEEVKKRGLPLNEKNERHVRELLRQEYGMAAYARLNLPRINSALKQSDVVIDGLYSWEEYTFLKNNYGGNFHIVAVWASPETRYARLSKRPDRPLAGGTMSVPLPSETNIYWLRAIMALLPDPETAWSLAACAMN